MKYASIVDRAALVAPEYDCRPLKKNDDDFKNKNRFKTTRKETVSTIQNE
jgi:hypothetical protein